MIRGIYTSAAALRAATVHQGRISHNLANLQTSGFKQVLTTRQAYELQRLGQYNPDAEVYINQVGGLEQGLLVPEEIVDFNQGHLDATQRPLDVAIEGDGFFRLLTADGERFTRDGSFHRDSAGQLVSADGAYVVGADGQPIVLPEGAVTITPEGTIYVDDLLSGQISLAGFADTAQLERENDNRYQGDDPQILDPNTVSIQQGYLETSNVDENTQVLEMMRVLRLYQASQRTLQIQDTALGSVLSVGEF